MRNIVNDLFTVRLLKAIARMYRGAKICGTRIDLPLVLLVFLLVLEQSGGISGGMTK